MTRDLKKAERAWMTFHQKKNPKVAFELTDANGVWPDAWVCVGECEVVYYRSDKWYSNGTWYKYYHNHGPNVKLWHPKGSSEAKALLKKGKASKSPMPIRRLPDAVAVLGDSLGWKVRPFGSKVSVVAEVDQGELLCCTPDQKHLVVIHPETGVTAVISGPKLRVEARGVVG